MNNFRKKQGFIIKLLIKDFRQYLNVNIKINIIINIIIILLSINFQHNSI